MLDLADHRQVLPVGLGGVLEQHLVSSAGLQPAFCSEVKDVLGVGRTQRKRLLNVHVGTRFEQVLARATCVCGGVTIWTTSGFTSRSINSMSAEWLHTGAKSLLKVGQRHSGIHDGYEFRVVTDSHGRCVLESHLAAAKKGDPKPVIHRGPSLIGRVNHRILQALSVVRRVQDVTVFAT